MGIEASIVVSFGDGNDSAFSVIELDNNSNGPNYGENWNTSTEAVRSVLIGGDVYFIVQIDTGYEIKNSSASSGDLVYEGVVQRTMESQMVFLDTSTENEFSYIPDSNPVIKKVYTVAGTATEPTWSTDKRTATAPTIVIPLVVDVEASCSFYLFKLTSPTVTLAADETWPIACLIEVDLI